MRLTQPPLLGRSWIGPGVPRLIACGHLATLAFMCIATSAPAATAAPDPSPAALRPDPFPFPASHPTVVVPTVVRVATPVSTRSPTPGQTGVPVRPAAASPGEPTPRSEKPSRLRERPQVAGSSQSATSHTPRRAVEQPKVTLVAAANEARGRVPASLGSVSPLALRIAATLLALLAVAGFGLAASAARFEGDG
jgi:hypothetical protein